MFFLIFFFIKGNKINRFIDFIIFRESETISQGSSIPVFQSHGGITSTHHSFQGAHLDGVSPPYMTNDQFGNIRPSWYDPYSDRYVNTIYTLEITSKNKDSCINNL